MGARRQGKASFTESLWYSCPWREEEVLFHLHPWTANPASPLDDRSRREAGGVSESLMLNGESSDLKEGGKS